jgi:hypothetical protein
VEAEWLRWLPLVNFFVLLVGLIYTVARVNLAVQGMDKSVEELKKAVFAYNERLVVIETTCKLRAECDLAHARAIVEREREHAPD